VEISITVSENEKYVVIMGKGTIGSGDPNILIQRLIEAHELATERGIRNILVDVTEARNTLGISESYDIVYHKITREPAVDRYARVALLVAPDDHSHDFTETLARNAGFNFTLYRDRDLALASFAQD
jgi:hypothetical protein